MKLLPIDAHHRKFLASRRALTINPDGDETLVGLTKEESAIYLEISANSAFDPSTLSVKALDHFLAVYERHAEAMRTLSKMTS